MFCLSSMEEIDYWLASRMVEKGPIGVSDPQVYDDLVLPEGGKCQEALSQEYANRLYEIRRCIYVQEVCGLLSAEEKTWLRAWYNKKRASFGSDEIGARVSLLIGNANRKAADVQGRIKGYLREELMQKCTLLGSEVKFVEG